MAEKAIQFTVDSQLMGELGARLVAKNYVALSELIKNSYDADATSVTVRLVKSSAGGPDDNDAEIELSDTGTGLTFEQVQERWMRVATPFKVDNPVSPIFGRHRTGNKGIGRFACQKISRVLEMETTAKIPGGYETTIVTFEWSKFIPGTDLTDIPCERKVRQEKHGTPGFTLRLKNLRDTWVQRDFDMLRRQVALLSIPRGVRRKGYEEDSGFEILLDAPEFNMGEGLLLEQVMKAGWSTLSGKVNAKGKVFLELNARYIGQREYELLDTYPDLRDVTFEIAWIPQDPVYYRDRKTLPKYLSEQLRTWGGVRMYANSFRVYPYGEPQDDWLRLDQDVARRRGPVENPALKTLANKLNIDSRPFLLAPRHRSLLGRVMITSGVDSPFQIKMDREGLVENPAYRDLIDVLRLSIDWMTLYFAACQRRLKKEQFEEAKREFVEATKTPEKNPEKLVSSALTLLAETAAKPAAEGQERPASKILRQAKEVIKKDFLHKDTELTLLRAVASTGPLMFIFAHEVKGTINVLDTHALYLEELAPSLKGKQRDEIGKLAESFRNTSRRFGQLAKLFGIFSAARNLDKRAFFLKKVVDQIVEGFGFIIGHFDIKVDTSRIDETLKTPTIVEAELYSILVNVLSNAIKALIAGNGDKIRIEASRGKKFVIRVLDNGIGLSKKHWSDVFEPLTIDPEHKIYPKLSLRLGDKDLSALGRGSGLGLSIVKGLIERHGGEVYFADPPANWKTSIVMELT